MKNEKLTGIERELVLQYLIDGNVPVTVTPVESENDADTIHSVPSQIFPVVIKGENVKVSKSGEISLKNLPESAVSFKSKNVIKPIRIIDPTKPKLLEYTANIKSV